jgi:hypothetical protein
MSWLALKLFFGGALKSVVAWLSHRSFWQIVCMALALLLIVQTIRVHAEQRHSRKVEGQLSKTTAELQRISSKRNEQQIVTREKIKIVTQHIHDADGKARVIEQAPLPGNCKTPPAILQADL